MSLPHYAVGWSVICDYVILWPYPVVFLKSSGNGRKGNNRVNLIHRSFYFKLFSVFVRKYIVSTCISAPVRERVTTELPQQKISDVVYKQQSRKSIKLIVRIYCYLIFFKKKPFLAIS